MEIGSVYYFDNSSVYVNSINLYMRVVLFDEFGVYYEGILTKEKGWDLNTLGRRRSFSFAQGSRLLFEQFAEYLGLEPINVEVEKILHPHLLLRIGRIRGVSWGDAVFESRLSIEEYLDNKVDRRIANKKLMVASIYLKGINRNGYPSKPELLHAENGRFFTLSELMEAANRIQTSIKSNKGLVSDGVGIYRSGEIKNGLPVYYIWGYYDLAGAMKNHEESGFDISLA